MAKYEYREAVFHGDPWANDGDGKGGYIANLNELGAQGWRLIWSDRDTTVRIVVFMEREIDDDDKDDADEKPAAPPAPVSP